MHIAIPDKYKVLHSSTLKIIALITMFIDHFAWVILYQGILYPNAPISENTIYYTIYQIYLICRGIGRIAFPVFCFLLVEGFMHTSNRRNYMLRLFIFALISEIPFNLAIYNQIIYPESCNVFFTLFIGLSVIWLMDILQEKPYFIWIPAMAGCMIAYYIQCDYDYKGILLIVVLYLFRYYRLLQAFAGAICVSWEWQAMFAFLPICFYSQQKGRNIKYFSYLFYPTHLLLLYLILKYLTLR